MEISKFLLCALAQAVLTASSMAQTPVVDPSSQQIIDALKPVKTRSFRNLGVRQAGRDSVSQGESAAQPSIDLAIQFEFGSSRITRASQKILDTLAVALTAPELADMRFRIEGHTDSKGAPAYNQKLSQARADEVKRTLVKHRIAADRLVPEGKAATEPLNRNDTTAPENRRVRIVHLEL